MQLDIFLGSTLFRHIFANLSFTAVLPNRTDVVTCGPKRPAPQLFLDAGRAAKDLPRRQALDDPDNLRRTVTRHRLHQKMYVIAIGSDLKETDFVTSSNVQTDCPQHLIDVRPHDDAPIFRGTHDVIQQDRNVMLFVDELAHALILPADKSPTPS
jgi:hypothetical protein